MIDVEALLREISPESRAGEDISYDSGFAELQRLAQGRPEQRIGDVVQPAEEPNWKEVRRRGPELLARSKDLRVVVLLALAELRLDGFPGLRRGLQLVRGLLEKYWDEFYPRLDPDDGLDPTERVNILLSLAPPAGSYQDPLAFPRHMREAELIASARVGRFCVRDVLIAEGVLTAPPDAAEVPDPALVRAAFEDSDPEALRATVDALSGSLEDAQAIESELTERVGSTSSIDFKPLRDAISEALRYVAPHVNSGGGNSGGSGSVGGESGAGTDGSSGGSGDAAGGAPVSAARQEISSREDVTRSLDRIIAYFEKHEPSSPIPLLLRRVRKLVAADFLDVIRELAPNSFEEIRRVGGSVEE